MSSRLREASGFALPLTLFAVTVVTVMLTAVFVRAETDRRIGESSGDIVDALAVAQSGLQTYLGWETVRPIDGDSIRINIYGGYADVVAHVVRKPLDTLTNWMYIIRSTGHNIEPTQGVDPQAVRTVAQFAQWQHAYIETVAALTAINGIEDTTTAGVDIVVDGNDQCAGVPIMGFRAPGFSEMPSDTSGSPGAMVQGSWSQVADETDLDWEGTTSGGFWPDHTTVIPGDTTFATYLIEGNLDLTNTTGTGLLIVTGELDSEGDYFVWDGIILVGGQFDVDADSTIVNGMVVSGLKKLLGSSVDPNEFNHDVSIYYNSCNIDRALEPLGGFFPIPNAWVDNWATY